MRDKEDRVRFSGYDVANFKIFVFCLASAFAAIGGAMFTLQVGFMSPSFVGIVPSIEMVIFCAVGGRHSLVGAVFGTLLVNCGKTCSPRAFPSSGCSPWAACSSRWCCCSRAGSPACVTDQCSLMSIGCQRAQASRHRGRPPVAERRRRPNEGARHGPDNQPDFLLAVEGVTVSFDGFKAVNDLNLYIDKGELRVIIGPNGAGKTTVLDLICGSTQAHRGLDQVQEPGDHRAQGARDRPKLGIGRKFQTPSIYEDLTVFENLEISFPRGRNVVRRAVLQARRRGHRERVRGGRRDDLPEGPPRRCRPRLLSHGQKQWLEIGMLLIQDPELLMLDEPVAGMSVSERVKTAELLNEIIKDRSVIVIEHDMKFVEDIAHRVTVLHQGKVLAEGDMDAMQANPKVKEVYLGH